VLVFLIAVLVFAAPWVAWCLVRYPREFLHEQRHVFMHLSTNVEAFAAPWDRLLADYLLRGFLEWYPLVIVATVALTIDALRARDSRRLFIAAWAWGVLLPHVLAASKTPTATLIGWPAGWLAVGVIVSDAIRGRRFAIGAMVATGILLIVSPQLPRTSVMGYGDDYRFGRILLQHWPVVASAVAIALVGLLWRASLRDASAVPAVATWRQGLPPSKLAIVLAFAFAVPLYRHVRLAVATSQDVDRDPLAFAKLGQVVRKQSPPNAVFLVDVQSRGEHMIAMWWLNRACYPLRLEHLNADAATIRKNGGEAFLLSRTPQGASPLLKIDGEGSIYALQP
jgi:hypothetical protein